MVKESMKKLLDKYPYFLDKNVTSNFYKVVNVQNETFKLIYQSLFNVYESFHLNKKLLVWKDQTVPYSYVLHFVANYPNLKTVKILKNDDLIYMEEYATADENSTFNYDYHFDTRNDILIISDTDEDEEIELTTSQQELYNPLLVWRINKTSDDDSINYTVNVKAEYPHLKKITVYKNENTLYTKTYNDTTESTLVEYSYDNTFNPSQYDYDDDGGSDDDAGDGRTDDTFKVTVELYNTSEIITKIVPLEEPIYIPEDQFIIEVETYDEYIMRKGFPERDTPFDNEMDFWKNYIEHFDDEDYVNTVLTYDEFDHDLSLDYIGYLNNIPRKEYMEIDTLSEYYTSEPPFNNRRSEDDYHYMKRIIEYNMRIWDTPAPVLEIWKLYGLTDVSMVNREHQLLKMFDILKHDYHVEQRTHPCYPDKTFNTYVVDGWVPEVWEHKDRFFRESNKLGAYFFASANTVRPVKHKPVTFTFQILNSLAEDISGDYMIDIYLGDERLFVNRENCKQWVCPADILDEFEPNVFTFVCHTSEKEIGRVEIIVTVRGCGDADFYVKADGNDNNNGSKNAPFRTLTKALSMINGVYDLIAVVGEINSTITEKVPQDCTIIGCKHNGVEGTITNMQTAKLFNVAQNHTLTLQDLNIKTYEPFTDYLEDVNFENVNITDQTETAIMYNMDYGILFDDTLEDTFIKNIKLDNSTGLLSWEEHKKNTDIKNLNDYDGIITHLELTDDFYYTEYDNSETLTKDYDDEYLYLSNRKGMLDATYYINNNFTTFNTTGKLEYEEYDDDIIYKSKQHGLDEFNYQHITATQGEFTPLHVTWLNGTLKIYLKILNPVVGQIINLKTSDGSNSSYKINSINGENLTFKPASGNGIATSYVMVQVVKNDTKNVDIELMRTQNQNGFAHIGSNTQLKLVW